MNNPEISQHFPQPVNSPEMEAILDSHTFAQAAFAASLEPLARAQISINEFARDFAPLIGRNLTQEAWGAIPDLIAECCEANIAPHIILTHLFNMLPEIRGGTTATISEPLISYVTELVKRNETAALAIELNSLAMISQIIGPRSEYVHIADTPTDVILKAARLELQERKREETPTASKFPLTEYADAIFMRSALNSEMRQLFILLIDQKNIQGEGAVVLRERFQELLGKEPSAQPIPPRLLDVISTVCRYYRVNNWNIEPLLPWLTRLRRAQRGADISEDHHKHLMLLHVSLCKESTKFEALSSMLFRPDRPALELSRRELAVAKTIADHFPKEPPASSDAKAFYDRTDILKNTAFQTAARLQAINASERVFRIFDSLLRAAPAGTAPEFAAKCTELFRETRLQGVSLLTKRLERKYGADSEFMGGIAEALNDAFNPRDYWQISARTIEEIEKTIEHCRENNLHFPEILAVWKERGYIKQNEGFWSEAEQALEFFKLHKLPLTFLSSDTIAIFDGCPERDREILRRMAIAVDGFLKLNPQHKHNGLYTLTEHTWNYFYYIEAPEHAVRLFERAMRLENPPIDRLRNLLERDLPMYALIQRRLALSAKMDTADEQERARIHDSIQDLIELENNMIVNDHPPHIISDRDGNVLPHAKTYYRNVLRAYRRMYDGYTGFSAERYEAQRIGGELAPLAQFGLDCAVRVDAINASDSDHFPGRGYLISGLLRDRTLGRDPGSPRLRPTYETFKRAWPTLANEIDQMDETQYMLTRGAIAVIPPQEPQYLIDGVHYSYIVFNEHMENPWLDVAYLVPTEVLRGALQGTLAHFNPESGEFEFHEGIADINTKGLSASDLELECKRRGLNLLNLGWGSNHSGGFANAFPPGSAPFHTWEIPLFENETIDRYGHVHKSHRFTGWRRHMDPELDAFLETTIRPADRAVYNHMNGCQNLLELFLISQSYWHRGMTLARRPDDDFSSTDHIEIDQSAPAGSHREQQGFEWQPTGDAASRMMIQGINIHRDYHEHGESENNFPILCVTAGNKLNAKPVRALFDTLDLSYFDGSQWYALDADADGHGLSERMQWESVMRQLNEPEMLSTLKDIRWIPRPAVPAALRSK